MQIGKFPMLTRDEENAASSEKLILSHGRLVVRLARQFTRYGADVDDLIQEGNIGLAIAAEKFQPELGFRFSTYAQFWVRQRMREHVVRFCRIARTPVTPKRIKEFFGNKIPGDLSMDAPLGEDRLFGDTIPSPDPRPDEIVEELIDGERMAEAISGAIAALPPRTADVIMSRFLKEEREGLEEIGARLGISRERVRQIETEALIEIRRRIEP